MPGLGNVNIQPQKTFPIFLLTYATLCGILESSQSEIHPLLKLQELNMAKHRPINERMAELQSQMVALQTKQNKDAVNADPKVMALDAEIDALNNTALKWKRWEKDAEKKVSDFQARVAEWENRGEQAESWLSQYKADLSTLKEQRNLVANEIAKGM